MKGETRTIRPVVNGQEREITVEVRALLSDVLRHGLGLSGTHVGCEHGVCGSCTVLVDGAAVRACLMLGVQADGRVIETVESLGTTEALSDLQQRFHEKHGLQCGFCTPGILMSVEAAARDGATLDETLHEVLGGHVCRCTGYQNIREAIEAHWAGTVDA
jgi:aerobic-type carbon monoxide dehydrogenase small subunit (CoxS/CutS family)